MPASKHSLVVLTKASTGLQSFGSLDYQGTKIDYQASSIAIGTSLGYAVNAHHHLGLGAWVSDFSHRGNENLTFPIYLEYSYFLKEEKTSPFAMVRLGNSFKSEDLPEVEDGLHFHLRLGYRQLGILRKIYLNPFVGLVIQQVKNNTIRVFNAGGPEQMITDDVTFTAVQAGLSFYIIK